MADTKTKTPGYVQGKDLAKLLHRTPGRITQLLNEGVLKKHKVKEGERYNLVEAIGDFVDYQDKLLAKPQTSGLDEIKARADIRLKDLKAERLDMELKELRGQFHRAEDIEAITNDFVFTVRSSLLSLPGRLAIDLAPEMTPEEVSNIVRKEVAAILTELSQYEYDPERYKDKAQERLKVQLIDEEENENSEER